MIPITRRSPQVNCRFGKQQAQLVTQRSPGPDQGTPTERAAPEHSVRRPRRNSSYQGRSFGYRFMDPIFADPGVFDHCAVSSGA